MLIDNKNKKKELLNEINKAFIKKCAAYPTCDGCEYNESEIPCEIEFTLDYIKEIKC